MLAAHFFPGNFLLIAAVYFAVGVFIIGVSFWATSHVGESSLWVVGGMCFGGIGAAIYYIGLLPIGIVIGAVAGCVTAITVTILIR